MINFSDEGIHLQRTREEFVWNQWPITNQFESCFVETSFERQKYRRPGNRVLHTACIHLGNGNTHIDISQVQGNIERALLLEQYRQNCKYDDGVFEEGRDMEEVR